MIEDLSEIKKVLRSAYWIQKRLDGALDRLVEMRTRIEGNCGIRYDRISVSGGGERSPLEEAVNALIDYENEVKAQSEHWTAALRLVNDIILGVPDERLRVLLTYRYRNYWHWEKIACAMNYSWKQVHRLHVLALVEAKKSYEALRMTHNDTRIYDKV